MKRCPQCEFIYEDEQSLCDMDGILLVFDSQQLPKPLRSTNSSWRGRIVPAVATLVLTTVLFLVYYVSTHQRPASPIVGSPSSAATSSSLPPASPATSTTDVKVVEPLNDSVSVEKEANIAPSQPTTNVDNKTKTAATPVSTPAKQSKPKADSRSTQKAPSPRQTKQDDSKIGSLIKKTGRLLKKPFKF